MDGDNTHTEPTLQLPVTSIGKHPESQTLVSSASAPAPHTWSHGDPANPGRGTPEPVGQSAVGREATGHTDHLMTQQGFGRGEGQCSGPQHQQEPTAAASQGIDDHRTLPPNMPWGLTPATMGGPDGDLGSWLQSDPFQPQVASWGVNQHM